jgi:hypothetical protein
LAFRGAAIGTLLAARLSQDVFDASGGRSRASEKARADRHRARVKTVSRKNPIAICSSISPTRFPADLAGLTRFENEINYPPLDLFSLRWDPLSAWQVGAVPLQSLTLFSLASRTIAHDLALRVGIERTQVQ